MSIHLIGVMHRDPRGRKRLQKALEYERPNILTVESSEEMAAYMRENLDRLVQAAIEIDVPKYPAEIQTAITNWLRKISFYEDDVSESYAAQNKIPFFRIDNPELTVPKIFFRYLPMPPVHRHDVAIYFNRMYGVFKAQYEGRLKAENTEKIIRDIVTYGRDQFMADKIRLLDGSNPDSKVVHVGGGIHNFTDAGERTLYSKLADLKPTRKTLREYDLLG